MIIEEPRYKCTASVTVTVKRLINTVRFLSGSTAYELLSSQLRLCQLQLCSAGVSFTNVYRPLIKALRALWAVPAAETADARRLLTNSGQLR